MWGVIGWEEVSVRQRGSLSVSMVYDGLLSYAWTGTVEGERGSLAKGLQHRVQSGSQDLAWLSWGSKESSRGEETGTWRSAGDAADGAANGGRCRGTVRVVI